MWYDDFDPNSTGVANGNYFGMPVAAEEAELVIVPVPWDVTTSYCAGTSDAPAVILDASLQVDLYDPVYPGGWKRGIGTFSERNTISEENRTNRALAERIIAFLEEGGDPGDPQIAADLARVNAASRKLNDYLYSVATRLHGQDKSVCLVGGDHSTPFGLIRAVAGREGEIGVLHIDAHADLRVAYEGFEHSHASIMYNVMEQVPGVSALVQVGLRDFCEDEMAYADSNRKITWFTDRELYTNQFKGVTWDAQCEAIVAALPEKVHVSFDIDGLSPDHCSNTGTPVPGGLSYNQALYLLDKVVASGRRIAGFDLCEVTPSQENRTDEIVGARILYRMCNLLLKSKTT